MPLIKDGIVTDDPYLRMLDEAPVPEGVPVLLPAARFLADAQDLADRPGKIGVIWPNNRDVAELAPWLDRLSLVALVFPSFKDGRAYSQARTLRERYRFRGELRATGDVLRDQFLFLHRVGFDAYRGEKAGRCACHAGGAASLQRLLSACRGRGGGRLVAPDESCPNQPQDRERVSPVTETITIQANAVELNRALAQATPQAVIEAAIRHVPQRRLAVVSSFGTESAVLLKFVADVDPSLPVLFLDTGWLFEETLDYRDELVHHLGLTDVRALTPQIDLLERRDPQRDLWMHDPESCCHIRKVRPLSDALGAFDGWMNGRKRFHGDLRADLKHVEPDGRLLKFNPLAALSHGGLAGRVQGARACRVIRSSSRVSPRSAACPAPAAAGRAKACAPDAGATATAPNAAFTGSACRMARVAAAEPRSGAASQDGARRRGCGAGAI